MPGEADFLFEFNSLSLLRESSMFFSMLRASQLRKFVNLKVVRCYIFFIDLKWDARSMSGINSLVPRECTLL